MATVANGETGPRFCLPEVYSWPSSSLRTEAAILECGCLTVNHWHCSERMKGLHGKASSFASAPAPEFYEPQRMAEQFDLQARLETLIIIKWAAAVRDHDHLMGTSGKCKSKPQLDT